MAFLIATIYNEGLYADFAWEYFPLKLKKMIGNLTPENILKADEKCFFEIRVRGKVIGAKVIKECAEKILDEFGGKAENLLLDDSAYPSRRKKSDREKTGILRNLMKLPQIGNKKARVLTKDFVIAINYEGKLKSEPWTIPFKRIWKEEKGEARIKDIDKVHIPPDIHAQRTVGRIWKGEKNSKCTDKELKEFGKKVYPEFPALVDCLLWHLGRNLCGQEPRCDECPLKEPELCRFGQKGARGAR